jgi:hypothetical protein
MCSCRHKFFVTSEEVRKVVDAYNIRERLKINKIKNDRIRLDDVCEGGYPSILEE